MKTETKHTPERWRVSTANDYSGMIIETEGPVNDRQTICVMEWDETESFDSDAQEVHKAHARLIAAAPELLEALRDFENVFSATERAQAGLRDFCVSDLQDAMCKARAAIARAERGQA